MMHLLLLLLLSISSINADCPLLRYTINSLFGPLHSVIDKNTFKLEEVFFFENTVQPNYFLLNYMIYGVTENLTILPNLAVVSKKSVVEGEPSTGLGDFTMQFNYRLYFKRYDDFQYRFIVTSGFGFPTTTISQVTLFSLKAFNGFVGIMQDMMTLNWFYFSDLWFIGVGKHEERKTGSFILYDWGGGRTFCHHDHYLTILLEFFGLYQQADRVNGVIDPTTGGHAAYIGPTVRYFYKNFYFHAGILGTISFYSRVPQTPSSYLAGLSVAYYF